MRSATTPSELNLASSDYCILNSGTMKEYSASLGFLFSFTDALIRSIVVGSWIF